MYWIEKAEFDKSRQRVKSDCGSFLGIIKVLIYGQGKSSATYVIVKLDFDLGCY